MSKRGKRSAASSAQAAELLRAGPGGPLSFASFAAPANATVEPPTEQLVDCDALGDEVRILFRHLNKRDAKTKLRALRQLGETFGKCEEKPLKAALGPWVQAVRRLWDDSDRSVRAELYRAMGPIMRRLKKAMLPHLKALMPGWWLSCHDLAKEVREAAGAALEAGIPRKKWHEALWMCRAGVVEQLTEVVQQTPEKLASLRKISSADALEMIQVQVPAALEATAQLVSVLGAERPGELDTELAPLLGPAFWRLAASELSHVRRRCWSAAGQIAALAPGALAEAVPAVAKAVLGGFSEREPVNLEALWQAVLALTRSELGPASWRAAGPGALSGLCALLEHGVPGQGAVSYRAVLPLLSILPPEAAQPCEQFCQALLGSLWAAGSAAEHPHRSAAADAYWECTACACAQAAGWTAAQDGVPAEPVAALAFYRHTAGGFARVSFQPRAETAGPSAESLRRWLVDRFVLAKLSSELVADAAKPAGRALWQLQKLCPELLQPVWERLAQSTSHGAVQLLLQLQHIEPAARALLTLARGLLEPDACSTGQIERLFTVLSHRPVIGELQAAPALLGWLEQALRAGQQAELPLLARCWLALEQPNPHWPQLLALARPTGLGWLGELLALARSEGGSSGLVHPELDAIALEQAEAGQPLPLLAEWLRPGLAAAPANVQAVLELAAGRLQAGDSGLLPAVQCWAEALTPGGDAADWEQQLGVGLFAHLLTGPQAESAFELLGAARELDAPTVAACAQMLLGQLPPARAEQAASVLCRVRGSAVAALEEQLLGISLWESTLADRPESVEALVGVLRSLMTHCKPESLGEQCWLPAGLAAAQSTGVRCAGLLERCLREMTSPIEAGHLAVKAAADSGGAWQAGLQPLLAAVLAVEPKVREPLFEHYCAPECLAQLPPAVIQAVCSVLSDGACSRAAVELLVDRFAAEADPALLDCVFLCCGPDDRPDLHPILLQLLDKLPADCPPTLLAAGTEAVRYVARWCEMSQAQRDKAEQWCLKAVSQPEVRLGAVRLAAVLVAGATETEEEPDEMEGPAGFGPAVVRLLLDQFARGRCLPESNEPLKDLVHTALAEQLVSPAELAQHTEALHGLLERPGAQQLAFWLLDKGLDCPALYRRLEEAAANEQQDDEPTTCAPCSEPVLNSLPNGMLPRLVGDPMEDEEQVPGWLLAAVLKWLLLLHKCCQPGPLSESARSLVCYELSSCNLLPAMLKHVLPWLNR